jgi:hypothetical protein
VSVFFFSKFKFLVFYCVVFERCVLFVSHPKMQERAATFATKKAQYNRRWPAICQSISKQMLLFDELVRCIFL